MTPAARLLLRGACASVAIVVLLVILALMGPA